MFIYDLLPKLALRMAKLATRLVPAALRDEIDPYADTFAAVQAIGVAGETRLSVFRLGAGALFVATPRLLVLAAGVRLHVMMLQRTAQLPPCACRRPTWTLTTFFAVGPATGRTARGSRGFPACRR